MAKFMIECPRCGAKNAASTFVWAKKTVKCGSCHQEFSTKENRIIAKICPGCGKSVVVDQAKLKNMRCPDCSTLITSSEATSHFKYTEMECPQCNCIIDVDKTKPRAICPICECNFDVQAELAKAKQAKNGISVIKYEGDNSSFVWKHPIEDFNLGSQLIVHENQEAIFFMNGEALDTFGPGRHTLETQNIPRLSSLYQLPTNGQNPFHAEVYFINLSVQMAVKWGTPDKVKFVDPETQIPFEIGASGEMSLRVSESRKLLNKLVGSTKGIDWDGVGKGYTQPLKSSFRGAIVTTVKSYLASVIKEANLNIFELDSQLETFADALGSKLRPKFEDYGLTIADFYVTNILLPEDNEDYLRLKHLKSAKYLNLGELDLEMEELKRRRMGEAIANADADKYVSDRESESRANRIRAEGFAQADVMARMGYSQKDVLNADVQKAFAAGMGQFGANNSGGGGAGGTDVMGMMMGMKVAGMMGDKLVDALGGNSQAAPAESVQPASDSWNCECGNQGIKGKFCPECGKPKPAPAELWNCECGNKGIKGKFCPECGKPKPELWDCECGNKGIKGKFCPECGKPKPAPAELWDCECGVKGIKGKFCPECGKPKA